MDIVLKEVGAVPSAGSPMSLKPIQLLLPFNK